MSDYLVNLARRSAGLAPMVRARVAPPVVVAEHALEASVESFAARGSEPAPLSPTVTAPDSPRVVTTAAPTDLRAPLTVAAVPLVNSAPPSVQRAPLVTAPSAMPAPITPPTAVPIPNAAARQGPAPQSELPQVVTVAAPRAIAGASATETRIVERVIETAVSMIEPAAATRAVDRGEAVNQTPVRAPGSESSRPIEPKVQQPATAAADAVAVAIEPAPRAESTVPVVVRRDETAATPERTVHVRIGAIEIHAGNATAAMQPAVPAAPLAVATASSTSPTGGFDDYAALRSYAPWAW